MNEELMAKAEEILSQSSLGAEDLALWRERLFGIFADDELLNDFIVSFDGVPAELGQATIILKQKLAKN